MLHLMVSFFTVLYVILNLLFRWLSFGTLAEANSSKQDRSVMASFSEELQPKDAISAIQIQFSDSRNLGLRRVE